MLYYKVKDEADGVGIPTYKDKHVYLVKRELYTSKEVAKLGFNDSNIPALFDTIMVSNRTTYYFFGCRFCTQYPYTKAGEKTIF